jgi:hypothetical protein
VPNAPVQPPWWEGRENMSGHFSKTWWGVALASCAALAACVTQASPTFYAPETVDFADVSNADTLPPVYGTDDVGPAVRGIAYAGEPVPTLALSQDFLDAPLADHSVAQPGLDFSSSTHFTANIEAGQIEAIDGWSSVVDSPADWRTPGDRSGNDGQPGFFSAVATVDPAATQIVSNVSVIPLPAALTSAGVTVGLIGCAYIVRRLRTSRRTH